MTTLYPLIYYLTIQTNKKCKLLFFKMQCLQFTAVNHAGITDVIVIHAQICAPALPNHDVNDSTIVECSESLKIACLEMAVFIRFYNQYNFLFWFGLHNHFSNTLHVCMHVVLTGLPCKGSRTGHFDKVSLWYASLLTNTRFRFLYFRISNW